MSPSKTPLLGIPLSGLALTLTLALSACQAGSPDAGPMSPAAPAAEAPAAPAADAPLVTVYKSPTCGCCSLWADHMAGEGFRVETVDTADLTAVRDSLGIPGDLSACHTATVEGYTLEGHVPADQVRRLLAERPAARGLAVPGMPLGSPGMEQGDVRQPYNVLLVDETGEAVVFAHVPGT